MYKNIPSISSNETQATESTSGGEMSSSMGSSQGINGYDNSIYHVYHDLDPRDGSLSCHPDDPLQHYHAAPSPATPQFNLFPNSFSLFIYDQPMGINQSNAITSLYNNNSNEFEQILYESLVCEGKHTEILSTKFQSYRYSEKMLREAAAFEVSLSNQSKEIQEPVGDEEDENPSKKAKVLSSEERAQINREKNREHARKTRQRKKIFVAKLKEMVDTMTQLKESQRRERIELGKRIAETRQLRHHIVKLFLHYRANNVQDRRLWEAICDESITMTLPITPYRYYCRAEVNGSQRVVMGIDALIIDTASLALMAESIGLGNSSWVDCLKRGHGCKMSYLVNDKTMISCGNVVSCGFYLLCEGHHLIGVHDINSRGMLQCKFTKSNRLGSIEFTFDVMGFMQQFQRATMLDPKRIVIPNTLQLAKQESRDARVITSFSPPYLVSSVNDIFWRLSGKTAPSEPTLQSYSLLSLLSEFSPPHNGLLSRTHWTNSLTGLLDRVRDGFPVRYHYPKHVLGGSYECCLLYLQFYPLHDDETYSGIMVNIIEIPISLSSFASSEALRKGGDNTPKATQNSKSVPMMTLPSFQFQTTPDVSSILSSLHFHGQSPIITAIAGNTTPRVATLDSSTMCGSSPHDTDVSSLGSQIACPVLPRSPPASCKPSQL